MARLASGSSRLVSTRTVLSPADSRHNSPSKVTRRYSPAAGSDKENAQRMPDKGKGRMVEVLPDSPPKRRRIDPNSAPQSSFDNEEEEEEEEEAEESEANDDDVEDVTEMMTGQNGTISRGARDSRSQKTARFYDQAQDEGERRELKKKARKLEREFTENRDEYLKSGNEGLTKTIKEADSIFASVKQTADATTDARLMVSVSDIAHRKATALALGDTATGIDVDEFVSKCISFMRVGTSTQSRHHRASSTDSDIDAEVLDWAHLGKHACFPFNTRPGVPGFLLGPLSVQKRARAATQRRARQRADDRPEAAPELLARADLATGETNTVRYACAQIKARLVEHCASAIEAVEAEQDNGMGEAELEALLRRHRITPAGGPGLFDFAVNPRSFAQTVENLFYISFLVKEGEMGIDVDADPHGLPVLVVNEEPAVNARARKSTRHQAVFGLDYATWRELVEAFAIAEPLIPHRQEEAAQVGARGWYT